MDPGKMKQVANKRKGGEMEAREVLKGQKRARLVSSAFCVLILRASSGGSRSARPPLQNHP